MVVWYIAGFVAALVLSMVFTPLVKRFAVRVGALDKPNHRKVHTQLMPRMGGIAIYLAFALSFWIVSPWLDIANMNVAYGLLIGGAIIVLIGALDDKFDLSPKIKLAGQFVAASIVVAFGVEINLLNVPYGDSVEIIAWLSIPITLLWIVGVTNAINLIDGLDGLAGGVSAIATATILVMAVVMGNLPMVVLLSALLLGSITGFLRYNVYPAKIFMGDSGALFLGFSLATLSVLGFKQITIVSFIIPILILGVPLSDTFFAIVRRWLNKTPISAADKSHLHHRLLQLGLSHKRTVLVIYGISVIFGLSAIILTLLSTAALWLAIVFVALILIFLEVGAEFIGIFSTTKKPLLNMFSRLIMKKTSARSRS